MKKKIFLFLLILLVLASCNDNKTYYKVTFETEFDTYYQDVVQNDYAKSYDNLEKEGYTFAGWYKDSTYTLPFDFNKDKITTNVTIYGKWEINVYDVILHLNNGDEDVIIKTCYNGKVELNDIPHKNDYVLIGWYKDSNLTDEFDITTDVIKNNIELYAKWVLAPLEVNFIIEDKIETLYVEKNELCNRPNDPIKEGYTFIGWYNDNELFDFNNPITHDINLIAKFERNKLNYQDLDAETKKLLFAGGFLDGKVTDFTSYVNTDAYRVVSTPLEFVQALKDAKYSYTNTWNEEEGIVEQTLISEGKVHVIEIACDLNLGYNVISNEAKASNIIVDYKTNGALSDMVLENGISQIKIENTSNLLIYSKNGAKITHAGFKLTSCHNVVFRNLSMDELWEWEDSLTSDVSKIGDYDKFGWAYFKISHCGQIWIDHMEFGKSYDGQIDYSNPVSNSKSTKIRLAYGSDGTNGLHISFCSFNAGSDEKDGYLYKMMEKMEDLYLNGNSPYLYYNALRDGGFTFDEILYGIAIPQKKGFLFGDNSNENDDFYYNKEMKVSFNSCKIINFCDRIPKVRGGEVYMYNCLIDSLDYQDYRNKVYAYGTSSVSKVNSSWKCAGVSQGFLVSYNGYIHVENSIIRGVTTLIKNNDTKSDPFVENVGYYNFINISYQTEKDKNSIIGSTIKNTPIQFDKEANNLKISTLWPHHNGNAPFNPNLKELDELEIYLNNLDYGAGVKSHITSWFISY